jgi:hypothetical protein
MAERITVEHEGLTYVFVLVEDFGSEDLERIAQKDAMTVIFVRLPLNDERREAVDRLPRTEYATGWALPPEVVRTLEEFKDWWMARLPADVWWHDPAGLGATLSGGTNRPEVSGG